MRTPRRLVAAVAVGLAAAFLVAAPPAATAEPAYGVDAVSIEPGPFTVAAMGTASALISVTLHDADGVSWCGAPDPLREWRVWVEMERVGGQGRTWDEGHDYAVLTRVAGDDRNGTWSGRWRIGSTRDGTWVVASVDWCVDDPDSVDGVGRGVDPRQALGTSATTVVLGSRPPTVSRRLVPAVVPWGGRQWLELTYRYASGAPIAGRALVAGWWDQGCHGTRTTEAQGRIWLRVYRQGASEWEVTTVCSYLTQPAGAEPHQPGTTLLLAAGGNERYERYARVGLASPPARVRAGAMTSLRGSVTPTRAHISVQRFVAGRWRPVASGLARAAGRYDIAIVVPRGTWRWRVVAFAPAAGLAPTASRVVLITGT